MIQSVAPKSAYTIGHQYFSTQRVRILHADNVKISAEVGGATGLYQQTIRLTEGTLISKCSCPSTERPICRHCVAVLLEYNRQSGEPEPVKSKERGGEDPMVVDITPQEPPREKSEFVVSPLGAGLREVMVLLDWLQIAIHALKAGKSLPLAPPMSPGDTSDWVATLQAFAEEFRRNKEKSAAVDAQLRAKETELSAMARDLENTSNKKNEALRVCEEMKLELEQSRGGLRRFVEIQEERDRLAESLKTLTRDMVKKAEQVDQLAAELTNMSVANSVTQDSRVG